MLAAAVALALALALTSARAARDDALEAGAAYLVARQQTDGGFAEPGGVSDPSLTAWVVLALEAVGRDPALVRRGGRSPADFLAGKPNPSATDLELRILALAALGREAEAGELAGRLEALRRPNGGIGPSVSSTIWGVIALRATDRESGAGTVRFLLRAQHSSGGWSWHVTGRPDSNDTAAAIEALRAAGVPAGSKALRRAFAYLRGLRDDDGGFELDRGRGSDAQSTAWATQAFLAAGHDSDRAAFAYLERLRRPDGSFRYSRRYVTTPVWVTAQVLPALAGRAFPLR